VCKEVSIVQLLQVVTESFDTSENKHVLVITSVIYFTRSFWCLGEWSRPWRQLLKKAVTRGIFHSEGRFWHRCCQPLKSPPENKIHFANMWECSSKAIRQDMENDEHVTHQQKRPEDCCNHCAETCCAEHEVVKVLCVK